MRAADMSVAAIGAVDYAKALDGLSLKQAQLMLTTQGIVGEEQKDLLVKQGLIATSDRMSASLVSEALANNGLNKEKQEELLIDLGLMNSKTKELITENAVTEAKFRAMLAEKGIKGAKADTLVASVLQTGANGTEAISWDVLTASIWANIKALAAWFVSSPVGWILMATGAVVGFIKVVDHFAVTAEKLNEQLQELKATEEELISTQDKLTEIDGKIAEIQSKGTLSITDKADISRLEQEKLLLKDEIELLKLRKELQQDEYNKNAKKYADGQYSNYMGGKVGIASVINKYKGYKAKSERTDIDDYFIEDAKRGLKETEAELIEYRNTINENLANLAPDDEESRKKLETIREAIEKLIYTEEDLAKIKFDRFIIDPNNTGISEGLEKIKSDGEATTQEITELANKLPTLKKFMDDNGISAETLAAELNNVGTEAENSGENVNKMTVSIGELEGASDKIKTLGSAFNELSEDGYITTKTLGEIQEATGLSGDEWTKYENKLINAKSGSNEFNQTLGELTYTILEEKIGIEKLADADSDYIATVLRENGVLNANEVAISAIRIAKIKAATSSEALANATDSSTQEFYDEIDAMKLTAEATTTLKTAYIQAQIAMTTLLQTNALKRLGMMDDELNGIKSYQDALLKVAELEYDGGANYKNDIQALLAYGKAQDEINNLLLSIKSGGTPNYSGNLKNDKSSSKNEALDNYLKDAENLYKIHQNEEKYINDLQWAYNNLTKSLDEQLDIIGKIDEANRKLTENQIKDIEHQIDLKKELYGEDADITEELNSIQTKAHEGADNYRAYARKQLGYNEKTDEEKAVIDDMIEKTDEVQGFQKTWWDAENKKVDWRFNNSKNWIDERNRLNDWHLFDDSEVEAWERVVSWLKEEYPNAIDEIKEAEENLFEARQQLIEDVFDAIEKAYDLNISRLNSQSILLTSHYDLVNAINEEQHNLNKELAEAEIAGAKMNEVERQTLFTKEEHARLSSKLSKIMGEANDLQSDYLSDLKTATEDTIEEITNNYERQYELKLKEYEIVKAELEVAKAQQRLENVENEKSVRTWDGKSWVYEANLQDVIDAQNAVEDAKYELQRSQAETAQQIALNKLDHKADSLETEKNKFTTTLDEITGKAKLSGKELSDALNFISENDLPVFEKIIQSVGETLEELLSADDRRDYSFSSIESYKYSSTVAKMKANSEKWRTASESERNSLRAINQGLGDSIGADYDDATGTWKDKNGSRLYANGTNNAKSGLGLFDENGIGSEFILTNEGIIHQFDGGEMVFSPEMKERLWKMAQNYMPFNYSVPDFSKLTSVDNSVRTLSNDTYYSINGVNINADEGASIKGFINYLKKKF